MDKKTCNDVPYDWFFQMSMLETLTILSTDLVLCYDCKNDLVVLRDRENGNSFIYHGAANF